MHNLLTFITLRIFKLLPIVLLSGVLFLLFQHNLSYAEETQLSELKQTGVSWGRKYFFDAPRFKDDNIQELLDAAIENKLNTYEINIIEGNPSSKYVLTYTLVLEESASELEIKDLYDHEPELEGSSDEELNFENGKFVISIRDRNTRKAIWRNNFEGIAGLDMSADVRQKRIHNFIDQVFENFPSNSNNTQNKKEIE